MVSRTCLDCGSLIDKGSRCRYHSMLYDKRKNSAPQRRAYRDPVYRSWVKDSKCGWCGATEDLTKDHIKELISGGTNDPSNLQTLCRSCQSVKENKRRSLMQ